MLIDETMASDNGAYVYALMVDGVVRYIGKGRNGRRFEHEKEARRINRKRAAGQKVNASLLYNKLAKAICEGRVISNDMTDEQAYAPWLGSAVGRLHARRLWRRLRSVTPRCARLNFCKNN